MISHAPPLRAAGLLGEDARTAWVRGMQQPAVSPFVSTVVNRLDAKGRVSIPALFRQILSQQNLQGVYCIPSFSEPALEAFGDTLLSQFQQRLQKYDPLFNSEYDDEAQAVLGRTQFLKLDDDGRVTLPADLIAHAGIGERVTFIGMGVKFQIWDPLKLEAVERERVERVKLRRLGNGAAP